jgi:ATP-dependent protease ClpP protease subunit
MIINLTGEVNETMVKHLLDGLRREEDCKILFSSPGGYNESMEAILFILGEFKDRVELIGYGDLSSCAFIIFFLAPCRKSILPSTTGMIHLPAMDVSLTQTGRPRQQEERWYYGEMKKEKAFFMERYKQMGLTPKELKKIEKGDDVYFSHSRMKELCPEPTVLPTQDPPQP